MTVVQATANQSAQQLTGRNYLSYSAISTYQRCPLAYYFRYVAALPEQAVSSSLVFGGAVHRAVEHHFRQLLAGAAAPSLEMLMDEYLAAWEQYDLQTVRFGKDENRADLATLAERMLTAFQGSPLARPQGIVLAVEEELRGSLVAGCPDLLGRLDLIVEQGDDLVVTDLKTSRTRWTADHVEESAAQLLLYHELVRQFVPQSQVRLQFAVVTKTRQPAMDILPVPADGQQIERSKRTVERVWRAIEAGSFYPAPSPLQCPGCPFRDACRAWPA